MTLRWRRWLVGLVAIVAGPLLLAGLVHLAPVRAHVLTMLVSRARAQYGLDLSVTRLDYNLLTLTARLEHVRVAAVPAERRAPGVLPAPGDAPFFEAEVVDVDLPWAIAFGRFSIESVYLSKPRLTLVRSPSGALNLPRGSAGPARGGGFQSLPMGPIGVHDGEVVYRNPGSGLEFQVRGIDMALESSGSSLIAGNISATALEVREGSQATTATRARGHVSFDGSSLMLDEVEIDAPEVEFRLDGRLTSLFDEPRVDVGYHAALHLAPAVAWTSADVPANGTISLEGRLVGPVVAPEATLSLSGRSLTLSTLTDAVVHGSGRVSMDAAAVDDFSLAVAGGELTATGHASFGDGDTTGEMKLSWRDLDLASLVAALWSDAPVRLAARLEGQADASWRAASPESVRLVLSSTARPPASTGRKPSLPLSGRTSLTVEAGRYALESDLRAGSVSLSARARGSLNPDRLAQSTLEGAARVEAADLSTLARDLRAAGLAGDSVAVLQLAGRGTVAATLHGSLERPELAGRVQAEGLEMAGAGPMQVTGDLTLDRHVLSASAIQVSVGPNQIGGHLEVGFDAGTLRGELHGELPSVGTAFPNLPPPWRPAGALDMMAQVGGTLEQPIIDATFKGRELEIAGQSATVLTADVHLVKGRIASDSIVIEQAGGGRLDASGRYSFASREYDGRLRASAFDLRPVPDRPDGTGAVLVSGRLEASLEGRGRGLAIDGKGTLAVTDLMWGQTEIGTLQTSIGAEHGIVEVSGTAPHLHGTFSGTVNLEGARNYRLSAGIEDLPLAELLAERLTANQPVDGAASVDIKATGALDDPALLAVDLDLRRFVASVGPATVRLEKPARVQFANGELSSSGVIVGAGGSRFEVSGRLGRTVPGSALTASLTGDLDDLRPFAALVPGVHIGEASGSIGGRLEASGSLDRFDLGGELTIADASLIWNGLPPATVSDLHLALADGVLKLVDLKGAWQGAVIAASGSLPVTLLDHWLPAAYRGTLAGGQRTASLSAHLDPITQQMLSPWLTSEQLNRLGVDGAATLSLEADGLELSRVRGDLVFDRMAVTATGVPLSQSRPTRISLAGGVLRVESLEWAGRGNTIRVSGTAPLEGETPLDLVLGGVIDLRLFSMLAPGLSTAGRSTIDLRVGGPLTSPTLDGHVDLSDGEMRLRQPRFVVSNVAGTLRLTKGRLTLERMTGIANGGTVHLEGTLEHEGLQLTGGALELTASRIAMDLPTGLRTEVDASLSLTPAPPGATLGGRLTVRRGAYRRTLILTSELLRALSAPAPPVRAGQASSWLDRLRLDLAVVTDDDIVVDNNYGQLAIGVDVRVGGTVAHPALGGRATAREGGKLYLGGDTYRLESGAIDFVDPTTIKPDFQFTARTRVSSYDVTLSVNGTPDEIRSTLTSEPPLTQGQIVSLLVTGSAMSDTGESTVSQTQLLSLLSGDILTIAGRVTGVDRVRLERGPGDELFGADPALLASETSTNARLSISKSLSSQVEIVLSQNLSANGGLTWIAIYRPGRRFEIRGVSRDDTSRELQVSQEVPFGGGSSVASGARPERRQEPRVEAVRIEGEPGFDEREIRSRFKLVAGDRFDFYRWQADRDDLEGFYHDRGYLEARISARREESGDGPVTLVYDVTRGPTTDFVVTGYSLPRDVMSDLREVWAGAIFDGFLLQDVHDRVTRALAEKGYLQATVTADVRPDESAARKDLVIAIEPGPRSTRRVLEFSGATIVTSDELQAMVEKAGIGLTAWLTPRQFESTLAVRLADDGLLSAKVAVGAPRFEGTTATLPVAVEEGPRFTVDAVELRGVSARPIDEVRREFAIDAGAPYVPASVDEARRRVDVAYLRQGFADVRTRVSPEVHEASAEVTLTVELDEGAQQVLTDVVVEGARLTRRGVIDGAIKAKLGEPVSQEGWAQARKRLYQVGAFRSVDVEFEPVGQPVEKGALIQQPVRAHVTLGEWPPYRFRYGFQIGDQPAVTGTGRESSPGAIAELQNRNVFGTGLTAGVTARWERRLYLGRLFASAPTFFSLPLTTSAYITRSRESTPFDDGTSFKTDRTMFTLNQQTNTWRTFRFNYGYQYERDHVFDPNQASDEAFPLDFVLGVSRLMTGALFDVRDNPFDPRRGFFLSPSLEFGYEHGSAVWFVRHLFQGSLFIPAGRTVVATGVRLGLANAFGDGDVFVFDRFFAGGGNTVRGYAEDSLGPRFADGAALGGDAMLVINQELRFPIYRWLRGVGFVDAGNVFEYPGDVSLRDLKVSVGFGLRLDTPFALLRLDFGAPVPSLPDSKFGRWYFSIGHVF